MDKRLALQGDHLAVTLKRLAIQIAENHEDVTQLALVGLQPRGVYLAERIAAYLKDLVGDGFDYGKLDSTFYRDDFGRTEKPLIPNPMQLEFQIEGKNVVFIDDVLYTGRSVRSALNAINDFGRPKKIELLVLVDRRYKRELPIEPDYVGFQVDTRSNDRVLVDWDEEKDKNNKVWIITEE